MTNAKHTPGPWLIHGKNSTSDINGPINPVRVSYRPPYGGGGYQIIADCSHEVTGGTDCEANARLIAAAPDLLEALQSLLNCTMYKDHPTESEMAKAAIAKATGAK